MKRAVSSTVVSWIPPKKKLSLAAAENLPRLDSEMVLLIEKKERELRKTINKLRVDSKIPGRRNELKKSDRPQIEKKFSVRRGFVDRLKVKVFAGRGGDGSVAFARGPNLRVAPPSGGDAGRGGDVVAEADARLCSLAALPRLLRAQRGDDGGTSLRSGRAGKSCLVRVPVGTQISLLEQRPAHDDSSNMSNNSNNSNNNIINNSNNAVHLFADDEEAKLSASRSVLRVLADLDRSGQRVVLAEGGKGGRGNAAFQSSTNRSPREATQGVQPPVKHVLFELKSIADVGLVGPPNAGKSSILYTASRATPKVASYPFTTLHPTVGIVQFDDYSSFSLCDIPGIVEKAHLGRGLGLEFLRHVERARALAFVVGADDPSVEESWRMLSTELDFHDPGLRKKKRAVFVLNKMDLPGAHQVLERVHAMMASVGIPVFGVSAAKKTGMNELMLALREMTLQKD